MIFKDVPFNNNRGVYACFDQRYRIIYFSKDSLRMLKNGSKMNDYLKKIDKLLTNRSLAKMGVRLAKTDRE